MTIDCHNLQLLSVTHLFYKEGMDTIIFFLKFNVSTNSVNLSISIEGCIPFTECVKNWILVNKKWAKELMKETYNSEKFTFKLSSKLAWLLPYVNNKQHNICKY